MKRKDQRHQGEIKERKAHYIYIYILHSFECLGFHSPIIPLPHLQNANLCYLESQAFQTMQEAPTSPQVQAEEAHHHPLPCIQKAPANSRSPERY